MPFEPFKTDRPAVSRNGVEVGKLRMLSEALKQEMPPTFGWNFQTVLRTTSCGTAGCAIGLAYQLKLLDRETPSTLAFEMAYSDIRRIFGADNSYGVPMSRVTPAMVAAELDRFIAREEAA